MLWKIYFWFLAISISVGYLGIITSIVRVDVVLIHLALILLGILRLIAVYSYVFKKSILKTNIWKVIFWIQILSISFELIDSFLLKLNLIPGIVEASRILLVLATAILLPSIYAIYKLSYPIKK